jgi:tRNA(fMet)-specific endonuclease VapC
MQVLTFDSAAAQIYDDLRRQRVRIGTMDLRIASSALSRQFVVLTRNAVDFSKVPGLNIEDWTS